MSQEYLVDEDTEKAVDLFDKMKHLYPMRGGKVREYAYCGHRGKPACNTIYNGQNIPDLCPICLALYTHKLL